MKFLCQFNFLLLKFFAISNFALKCAKVPLLIYTCTTVYERNSFLTSPLTLGMFYFCQSDGENFVLITSL